ncbi:hypothetical protein K491DRAFT_497875 [Lophiostoma macrostomum CBS 122681]|uniref:Uncharacterized protein n=1 Tax=Lophiostoma macrostomum CBS 122681 TaxID=1314788 RepID=A0A6A6T4Y4_9PLEO|nr:hypothetical protein K491DRAFT_497875 [Lophiostoma macrostomum CBS 122681]
MGVHGGYGSNVGVNCFCGIHGPGQLDGYCQKNDTVSLRVESFMAVALFFYFAFQGIFHVLVVTQYQRKNTLELWGSLNSQLAIKEVTQSSLSNT